MILSRAAHLVAIAGIAMIAAVTGVIVVRVRVVIRAVGRLVAGGGVVVQPPSGESQRAPILPPMAAPVQRSWKQEGQPEAKPEVESTPRREFLPSPKRRASRAVIVENALANQCLLVGRSKLSC